MPHSSGKCDCGRTIHFPKNASLGYEWICKKCGKSWVLSNHGQPLNTVGSKAPKKTNYVKWIIVIIIALIILSLL